MTPGHKAKGKNRNELKVWTIGHSNRSAEYFLELLRAHGIQTLVDARRFPISKIDHFKGVVMEKWLRK